MINTDLLRWNLALAKAELRVANVLNEGRGKAMADVNRARAAYNRSVSGKPARRRFEDTIPVIVAGIPASVHVVKYTPAVPAKTWALPENCYPEEDAEIEYVLCDSTGYEAGKWLLNKVDNTELENYIFERMKNDNFEQYQEGV